MTERHLWWQRGVIYQVYPRSFADSDGDGIGDLEGVRARLEYLEWLGVDAIWLSPIFPSPMVDFGYDVADYTGVDPIFGTIGEFDRLLTDAHRRGIRVILDYVPNHTSDRHHWFVESRSSRDSAKRDWYIWRDPAPGGGPPNNWLSAFGGSAWEWDAASGQYYLHLFATAQPDLNWRNPDVRRAMLDALRFWLDRGVDGFRVDVLWLVIKDEQLRDNPPNPDYDPATDHPSRRLIEAYSSDQPEVHEVVAEMRSVLDEYDERVFIGEIYLPVERLVAYYGAERPGAHLPYNFHLLSAPWQAREVEALIARYEGSLPSGGWPNWVLGNHDNPRAASRLGEAQARVAAMLLLTLRGTPTIYYGEEIGMRDVEVPPELVHDPEARIGIPYRAQGRDPYRTPMQWEPGAGAGFTRGSPWLPVSPDAGAMNVATERQAPDSMLSLYRSLLALRRRAPALSVGAYAPVAAPGDVLAYLREGSGDRFLIALNFADRPGTLSLGPELGGGRLELSTLGITEGEAQVAETLRVRPNEGVVVRLASCRRHADCRQRRSSTRDLEQDGPMFPPEERERLPLPSEDSGDLVDEPSTGETDDPLVAEEEAVTYVPPLDRVISEPRPDGGGPDVAGAAADEAEELEREDDVQPVRAPRPRDDALLADVLETLRDSDLPAGEDLRLAARGSTVIVRGEVESVDILDEILGLIGDVPGVENVVDEVQVRGV